MMSLLGCRRRIYLGEEGLALLALVCVPTRREPSQGKEQEKKGNAPCTSMLTTVGGVANFYQATLRLIRLEEGV